MERRLMSLSANGIKRGFGETGIKVGARICVVLAAFAVTTPALAGEAGWSEYTTVAELTPTDQQRYEFKLNLSKNPAGCKSSDTFYQDYDSVGSDRMYNLLLQAVTNGKKVRVHVTGRCELNGYAEISVVSIVP